MSPVDPQGDRARQSRTAALRAVKRGWHELWEFTSGDATQTANLTELVKDGIPAPELILSSNDGGDEGWVSLDREAARRLRDALSAWLHDEPEPVNPNRCTPCLNSHHARCAGGMCGCIHPDQLGRQP